MPKRRGAINSTPSRFVDVLGAGGGGGGGRAREWLSVGEEDGGKSFHTAAAAEVTSLSCGKEEDEGGREGARGGWELESHLGH